MIPMKISKNKLNLLRRASMVCDCRLLLNTRKGFRRHHPLGSTYAPQKIIRLNGRAYSWGSARLYLKALGDRADVGK